MDGEFYFSRSCMVMAVLKHLNSEELFCRFLLIDSDGRFPSCKLVLIKNKCQYFSALSGTTLVVVLLCE